MPVPGLDLGLPPEEELSFKDKLGRMIVKSRPNTPTWAPFLEDMNTGSKTPSYNTDFPMYGRPPDRPIEGGRNEGKNYQDVYPEQDRTDPDAVPFGRDNLALADDLISVVQASLPGVIQYGPNDLIDGRFSNLNPPTPGSVQDRELIDRYSTFGAPDTKALWDMYSRDMEIPGQLPGSEIPSWDDLKIQAGEKTAGNVIPEKQEEFTEEAGVPGQKYETPASISMGQTLAKYKDYEEFAEEAGVPPGPTRTWGETLSRFSVSNAMKLITDAASAGKSTEEQALAFEQGFILPMIKGMYEGIKKLRTSELVNPETGEVTPEAVEQSFLTSLDFMAPGYARALAAPKGAVELGMFGGRSGKGFEKATKTSPGLEGKPRYEISDRDLAWQPNVSNQGLKPGIDVELGSLIKHDKVFDEYPELAKVRVQFDDSLRVGDARVTGTLEKPVIIIPTKALDTSRGLRDLAHEMQHWIQEVEGFARGGSPGKVLDLVDKTVDTILRFDKKLLADPQLRANLAKEVPDYAAMEAAMFESADALFKKLRQGHKPIKDYADLKEAWESTNFSNARFRDALDGRVRTGRELFSLVVDNQYYKRLGGEVEAENVGKRLRMTDDERRRVPPEKTEKYPRSQQILKMHDEDVVSTSDDITNRFTLIEGGAKEKGKSGAPLEIIEGSGPKTPIVPAQVLDDMRSAATHGELEDIGRHLNTLDDAIESVHPSTKEAAEYRKLYNELSRREDQLYDMGKSYEAAPWEERMRAAGIDPTSIEGKAIATASAEIDRAKEWLVVNRNATKEQKAKVRQHIQQGEEFIDRHYSLHQMKKDGLVDETGQFSSPTLDKQIDVSWERMAAEQRDIAAQQRREDFNVIEGGREFRRAVGRARKEAEDSYANAKRAGEEPELLRQRDIYANELRRVQAWQRRQVKDAEAARLAGMPPPPVDKFQGMIDQAMENAAVAKGNIAQLTAQGDLFGQQGYGIKGGLKEPANQPQQQYNTGDKISRDPNQMELDLRQPDARGRPPFFTEIKKLMPTNELGNLDELRALRVVEDVTGKQWDKFSRKNWENKLSDDEKHRVFNELVSRDTGPRKDLSSKATPEIPARYENNSHLIIDGQTGKVVGGSNSLKAGSRSAERRNLEHGGHRYYAIKKSIYLADDTPRSAGAARTPPEDIHYREKFTGGKINWTTESDAIMNQYASAGVTTREAFKAFQEVYPTIPLTSDDFVAFQSRYSKVKMQGVREGRNLPEATKGLSTWRSGVRPNLPEEKGPLMTRQSVINSIAYLNRTEMLTAKQIAERLRATFDEPAITPESVRRVLHDILRGRKKVTDIGKR